MKGRRYLWKIPLLSLVGSLLVRIVGFLFYLVGRTFLMAGKTSSTFHLLGTSAVVLTVTFLYILSASYFFCAKITRKQCLFSCFTIIAYMLLQSILLPFGLDLMSALLHWPSPNFIYSLKNLMDIPVWLYGTIPQFFADIEKARFIASSVDAQALISQYVYGTGSAGYSIFSPVNLVISLTPFLTPFLFLIFAGRKLPKKAEEDMYLEG